MSTRDNARRGGSDRPFLAGGEALRRQVDRPPRGGPKYDPFTIEDARAILQPQIEAVRSAVAEMPEHLRSRRVVIEATLLPNYLAASYFPSALLQAADLIPIGTRPALGTYRTSQQELHDQPTKRLLLAGTDHSIRRLQALVEGLLEDRLARSAVGTLREFFAITLPTAEEIVHVPTIEHDAAADAPLWEAVLHPLGALEHDRHVGDEPGRTYDKWRDLVASVGGRTIDAYRRESGGLTFVPVRVGSDEVGELASFNPLRTIRPMPTMRPIGGSRLRRVSGLASPSPVDPAARPRSDIRVAVFDGGIDQPAPLLDPFVREIDRTPEPKTTEDLLHGSAVTSALTYGYVEPGQALTPPDVQVDHFRVFPDPEPDDPDAYWILDQIVDVVSKNDYALVNLSLGPDQPIDDDTPHLWTIELDRLAYEKGTLFISAVGKSGGRLPISEARLQPASDMVNGVGVGACTARTPNPVWERAPYSSIGPGRPGARVQPLGLSFGGSSGEPFYGLLGDGSFVTSDVGTSFATPLAAHGIAGLAADLGHPRASSATLRALAVHFAEPHASADLAEVGFGRLRERYDDVWECPPESVTVMYEDSIARDEVVALLLPWPDGIERGRVSIRWTLAFTTSIDGTDPVDYTRSGVEITFRPHYRRLTFTDPTTRKSIGTVYLDDADAVGEMLARGGQPASQAASRSPERVFASESARRDAGKWETIIHQRDSLIARSLARPELDLAHLARDAGLLVSENVPPLDYTLIVTIAGPSGLYDAVRQGFPVLTPLRPVVPSIVRV